MIFFNEKVILSYNHKTLFKLKFLPTKLRLDEQCFVLIILICLNQSNSAYGF